jgi:hypothetical protein
MGLGHAIWRNTSTLPADFCCKEFQGKSIRQRGVLQGSYGWTWSGCFIIERFVESDRAISGEFN